MRTPYRYEFCTGAQGGNSSVGRARPCQGRGREFESRFPLQDSNVAFSGSMKNRSTMRRGNSSVGRARPCQGRGREFESRFPLQKFKCCTYSRVHQASQCGNSSVGRARPCQGRGREFESRFPLQFSYSSRFLFSPWRDCSYCVFPTCCSTFLNRLIHRFRCLIDLSTFYATPIVKK
jgi:hypothetical protein